MRHSRHNRILGLALLIALLPGTHAGCATHQQPAATPASGLTQASSYQTTTQAGFVRGEATDAELETTLAGVARSRGLTLDGRLAELALGITLESARQGTGAQRPPSFAQVSYHAHRAGLAEPTPQVWLASGGALSSLLPGLTQAVIDATASSALTHVGAAAVYFQPADPAAGVIVALALSSRLLTLDEPVPRSIPTGGVVRVAGTLAKGHAEPILVVTSEAGITRLPLGKSRDFRRDVPASTAGELTLELLATGPEGLTVVALMPVMVGAPVLERAPAYEEVTVETSATEVMEKLLALIAEERHQRNLPVLQTNVRLSSIAQAHSEDMRANDFIAHTSKRSGDATQRVRSAGLDARLVLENIGRGYSATELHRGLMESPGHRANILHPDARELGIGVVSEREGERDAFLVTELFTQLVREQ